jgi:hypothetical protein
MRFFSRENKAGSDNFKALKLQIAHRGLTAFDTYVRSGSENEARHE